MKKRLISPLMVASLVLVLLLAAGCNRPDAQAPLDAPTPVGAQVQPTLPLATTPTLPPGEMPSGLAGTLVASTPVTGQIPTMTPLPPLPTAQLVVSTPVPPTPTAAALEITATGGKIHTVQPGERLFSIARLYNVNPYAIAQLNAIPAPYLIYPGQKLKIPGSGGVTPPPVTPPPGGTTYTVLPGDNLFRIALKFGKSMQAIAAANGIVNYNLIYPGQVLKIP
jgi:LysM repeat protein